MTSLTLVVQHLGPENLRLLTRDNLRMLSRLNKEYRQLVSTQLPKALLAERIRFCRGNDRQYHLIVGHLRNLLSYPTPQVDDDDIVCEGVERLIFFTVYSRNHQVRHELCNTIDIVDLVNDLLDRFLEHHRAAVFCINFLTHITSREEHPYKTLDKYRYSWTIHEMFDVYKDHRDQLFNISLIILDLCDTRSRSASDLVMHDVFTVEFSLFIIKVMRKYICDSEMSVNLMKILKCFCSSPVLHKALVEGSLVESIADVIHNNLDNKDVATEFFLIMRVICQGHNREMGIRKVKGLDLLSLVEEVLRQCSDYAIHCYAVEFKNICYGS
jgi:hypothetical protein